MDTNSKAVYQHTTAKPSWQSLQGWAGLCRCHWVGCVCVCVLAGLKLDTHVIVQSNEVLLNINKSCGEVQSRVKLKLNPRLCHYRPKSHDELYTPGQASPSLTAHSVYVASCVTDRNVCVGCFCGQPVCICVCMYCLCVRRSWPDQEWPGMMMVSTVVNVSLRVISVCLVQIFKYQKGFGENRNGQTTPMTKPAVKAYRPYSYVIWNTSTLVNYFTFGSHPLYIRFSPTLCKTEWMKWVSLFLNNVKMHSPFSLGWKQTSKTSTMTIIPHQAMVFLQGIVL